MEGRGRREAGGILPLPLPSHPTLSSLISEAGWSFNPFFLQRLYPFKYIAGLRVMRL